MKGIFCFSSMCKVFNYRNMLNLSGYMLSCTFSKLPSCGDKMEIKTNSAFELKFWNHLKKLTKIQCFMGDLRLSKRAIRRSNARVGSTFGGA